MNYWKQSIATVETFLMSESGYFASRGKVVFLGLGLELDFGLGFGLA